MIFDLFCPIDMSVNDGILSKYREINYESLEKAIKLIAKTDHEVVMMKHDLKFTFYHILVSLVDY